MCVWLPGPGDYAMAIYQDTNGNRHFDHGTFGPTATSPQAPIWAYGPSGPPP